jgi:hypothetical protein
VQGVTINIIKPICKSICLERNIFDKANANKGVKIKLISNAETEKRKSENDFDISFIFTLRKTKKSIDIKKNSIYLPAFCSIKGINFPIIIPAKAERIIKNG